MAVFGWEGPGVSMNNIHAWAGAILTSTAVWKMAGVVSDEKVMVLEVNSSAGKLPRNWLMMDVLAVPGPPTSRDACADACSKDCGS